MRAKVISALVVLALALSLPLSGAWAASGDLDEIVDYYIYVDVNDDATLTMTYHINWKVLDSTKEGPLTWVRVGIPNKHYVSMQAESDTIKSIEYDSSGGSYARIDLDRAYHAGETVSFDFSLVQDYMYQVGRDNQGEAVYEFTPGWFDDIEVDSMAIIWDADKVDRIAPAAQQISGFYVWEASLDKGERYTVTVGYPDDAFAFDVDKTILKGNQSNGTDDSDIGVALLAIAFTIGLLAMMGWAFYALLSGIARAVSGIFELGSGFSTGKKVTRTKVVYYPECQGCGSARPEGKDTCEYCGRSYVKSEEIVTEEDIPAQERAIKGKTKAGEYAYSSEPNTFLRVSVVPVHVSGGGRSRSRSSGSCACASSCACACGCACACACAGGGRAGCSTKDFHNTNLRLSQIRRTVAE